VPGEQLVHRRAEAVDVHPAVEQRGVAEGLLRRHVLRRAERRTELRLAARPDLARQPEVDDRGAQSAVLPVVGAVDQDVGRFDVAMDQPHAVRRLDRLGDVAHELHALAQSQARTGALEGLALDELHRDVGPAVDLAGS
jgi:hypothetical protein